MPYFTRCMYTRFGCELEALTLVNVGCSLKLRSSTGRRNSCSIQSYAKPAQQQQSGPDISQLNPELQSQWDHERNAHLGSIAIKPQSNRRVHWVCTECPDQHPHRWAARVQDRTVSQRCPFCSGQKVCPHNSLPSTAPQVAMEWDTAKNPGSPHDYTARSNHRAHWLCDKCDNEWQVRISERVKHGTGCPQCASNRRRLPTVTASSSSAKQYWDLQRNAEQGLDPDRITVGSAQKANFICGECPMSQPHTWTAVIQNVFRGRGCPCCSGRKVCKCNSLQTFRPDLAAEWCYALNESTPDDYTAQSHAVVWWQNDKHGRWKASIKKRFESTCMPEVTLVLKHFVQCCVGFTPPASSYVCIVQAHLQLPLDVLACDNAQCSP